MIWSIWDYTTNVRIVPQTLFTKIRNYIKWVPCHNPFSCKVSFHVLKILSVTGYSSFNTLRPLFFGKGFVHGHLPMTYHISTPISEFTCTYIFPSGGHIKAIEWRRVKALYNFLLRQGRSLMYYMYPFFLLTSGKGILQPLAASNTCIVKGGFSMHFDLYSNMPFPSSS